MNASQITIHPVEELERRVQALDEAVDSDQESTLRPLFYTEEDLLKLYEDVMSVPLPENVQENRQAALEAIRRAEEQEDVAIIDSMQRRLLDGISESSQVDSRTPVYRRILVRAHEIFTQIEATRNAINPGTTNRFPLSVLSIREFQALMRQSLNAQDFRASEIVLEIMKKSDLPLSSDNLTTFLEMYAVSGNIKAADELLANFLTETPTELQRHLHIQTHLRATPLDEIPTSAMDLLHQYEEQSVPAPMHTYTSVITALLSRPLSLARAQAWDIFSHMRYVAHPYPDVVLYTQMIRACASPVSVRYSSEPEKALDLWTEMTVDRKIRPTVGSYNAVILACARSGEKVYVNEAFRLARQMLDSHRDAQGVSSFRPDRKTFCALLEGAKRTGNLARARWILAEMVAPKRENDPNAIDTEIDEEIMMHIFNAYASYKPPVFKRAETASGSNPVGSQQEPTAMHVALNESSQNAEAEASLVVENQDENPSFAHIPPQMHAEVIREVKILLNRIIDERKGLEPVATASLPIADQKFRHVEITSRLLGAYLSVFYKHASLDASRELFWKLFDDFDVPRTPRICVEALERCGNARRGHERTTVVPFADQLWEQWIVQEDSASRAGKPLPSRLVERAHIAMIRTLAVTENVDRALSQLKAFAAKYPPNEVRTPAPKPNFRSTRTSLVGHRPLVRMTSAAEVPDDYVPPLVTFRDVEILHHRLIDYSRKKDIAYVTWLCKAYEWALRVRRDEAVKAKPRKADAEMKTPVIKRIEEVRDEETS
ncbi:hypothetical protein BDN70DRAFT_798221 [Pholiota conissans]|uniref:Pentatricopeptide repeat-containing protein n=1 Tax=Pholiota conissans TaxID=109636 RepID=A0A9P5Z9X2_9AGAR|nr:hypothetical protein BDN70DRAFT_798221 [Pholiota conissans]